LGLVNHPDAKADPENRSRCVGNYLDYGSLTSRGPNGETVHAVAYIFRWNPLGMQSHIGLGWAWFHSIGEAKAFIQGNVQAYFGLPRDQPSRQTCLF
jgi:hypothetical protein